MEYFGRVILRRLAVALTLLVLSSGCSFTPLINNKLSGNRIPTVLYGPGGEGAHAVVEWVDLAQAERCTDVLIAVARDFCA